MTNDSHQPNSFKNEGQGKDTNSAAKKGLRPDVSKLKELRSEMQQQEARLSNPDTANDEPQPPQYSENLQRILRSQVKIRLAKSQRIEFTRPIVRRGADPVIFPNTIVVIQGKAGVHKSRLAEVLCSCILSINLQSK
jgi:hypothetical protein